MCLDTCYCTDLNLSKYINHISTGDLDIVEDSGTLIQYEIKLRIPSKLHPNHILICP